MAYQRKRRPQEQNPAPITTEQRSLFASPDVDIADSSHSLADTVADTATLDLRREQAGEGGFDFGATPLYASTPQTVQPIQRHTFFRSMQSGGQQNVSRAASHGGVPLLQAKLTVGAPNDPYEQEADRVASQVVDQINAPVAPQMFPQQQEGEGEGEALQMHPLAETIQQQEEIEDEEALQTKSLVQRRVDGGGQVSADLESSIQAARGQGRPLGEAVRNPMEQAFGSDFSSVRVHTDAQSDQLNRSVQAKAFTTGQDIFFKQGEYNPSSRVGQELLAHELTHVVQQSSQTLQRTPDSVIQRDDDDEPSVAVVDNDYSIEDAYAPSQDLEDEQDYEPSLAIQDDDYSIEDAFTPSQSVADGLADGNDSEAAPQVRFKFQPVGKKAKGVYYRLIERDSEASTEYFYNSINGKFYKRLHKKKATISKKDDLKETNEVTNADVEDSLGVMASTDAINQSDLNDPDTLFYGQYDQVISFIRQVASQDNFEVIFNHFNALNPIQQYKVLQTIIGTEKLRRKAAKDDFDFVEVIQGKLKQGIKAKAKQYYEASAVEQHQAKYDWKKFAQAMRMVAGSDLLPTLFVDDQNNATTDLHNSNDFDPGNGQKYAPPVEEKKVFRAVKEILNSVQSSIELLKADITVFGEQVATWDASSSGAEVVSDATDGLNALVPNLGLSIITLTQEINLLSEASGNLNRDQIAESVISIIRGVGKITDCFANIYNASEQLARAIKGVETFLPCAEQALQATIILEPILGGIKLASGIAEMRASRMGDLKALENKFNDQAISQAVNAAHKTHALKRTTGAMKAASGAAQLVGGTLIALGVASPVGWAFLGLASAIGLYMIYNKVKTKHKNINAFVNDVLKGLPDHYYSTKILPAIYGASPPPTFDKNSFIDSPETRHLVLQALSYSSAKDFYNEFMVEVSRGLYNHAVVNYNASNQTCQEAYEFVTDGLGLTVDHSNRTPTPAIIGRLLKGK